jgi:flagellar motor switch protein FliM
VSAKSPRANALVRTESTALHVPVLDEIGQQFAREMQAILSRFGGATGALAKAADRQNDFEVIAPELASSGIARRIRLKPGRGSILIACDRILVARLTDLLFGGDGDPGEVAATLTAAEKRVADELLDDATAALLRAWAPARHFTAEPAAKSGNALSSFAKPHDAVTMQRFAFDSGPLAKCGLSCVYLHAFLRQIPELAGAVVDDEPTDPAWQSRLRDAVMQVRLPVRTIFARPDWPVSRLMALKPGDVIPIALPKTIPITVGGRRFATATVGEANGRAAINLEQIETRELTHG